MMGDKDFCHTIEFFTSVFWGQGLYSTGFLEKICMFNTKLEGGGTDFFGGNLKGKF